MRLFNVSVSGRLVGKMLGKRDLRRPPWQLLRRRLGGIDMLLPLALAGATDDLKNALLRLWPCGRPAPPSCIGGSPTAAVERLAWPGGSSIRGAPAVAAERISFWTASRYICTLARVCIHVVSECAPTCRTCPVYPTVLRRLAGGAGKERFYCFHLRWQLSLWSLGWKDMLLPLALAGPAGDLKNALLRRRLGWYVANRV